MFQFISFVANSCFLHRYHGSMSERAEIKDRLREYLPKKKGTNKGRTDLDVVLTTFSYFSSEKQDDRHFLRKFEWNYVSSRPLISKYLSLYVHYLLT